MGMSVDTAIKEALREVLNEQKISVAKGPQLLDKRRAASMMCISVRKLDEMIANSELPKVPCGSKVLVDVRDIEAWITRNKT